MDKYFRFDLLLILKFKEKITKGTLLSGYFEFYFMKQSDGLDCLVLND